MQTLWYGLPLYCLGRLTALRDSLHLCSLPRVLPGYAKKSCAVLKTPSLLVGILQDFARSACDDTLSAAVMGGYTYHCM